MVIQITKPYSRGTIKLRSNKHTDRPVIQTNLLSDPRDLQTLKQGTVHPIK